MTQFNFSGLTASFLDFMAEVHKDASDYLAALPGNEHHAEEALKASKALARTSLAISAADVGNQVYQEDYDDAVGTTLGILASLGAGKVAGVFFAGTVGSAITVSVTCSPVSPRFSVSSVQGSVLS